MDIGTWNNKIDWPIPWIQISSPSLKSLGISFSNDYNMAVNENWENVISAITTKIQMMQTTQTTIYQRSVLLNSVIFSKLWYVAHIFPLPATHANRIKRIVFNYLWGRKFYKP